MGSLARPRVLGTSALAGSKERSPPSQTPAPLRAERGGSALRLASAPLPFPVFTIRNQAGFLLSALLSPPIFFTLSP